MPGLEGYWTDYHDAGVANIDTSDSYDEYPVADPEERGRATALQAMSGVSVVDVEMGVGKRILTGHYSTKLLVMGGSLNALVVVDGNDFGSLGYTLHSPSEIYESPYFHFNPRICRITGWERSGPEVGLGPGGRHIQGQEDPGVTCHLGARGGKKGNLRGKTRSRQRQTPVTPWVDVRPSPVDGICTCAAVSGAVLFLGYHTEQIIAVHVMYGQKLYRLIIGGLSPVRILPDKDSLLVYCFSGNLTRWWWPDEEGRHWRHSAAEKLGGCACRDELLTRSGGDSVDCEFLWEIPNAGGASPESKYEMVRGCSSSSVGGS
ncbi:unnamed protein product [Choristocarpus tenellus]